MINNVVRPLKSTSNFIHTLEHRPNRWNTIDHNVPESLITFIVRLRHIIFHYKKPLTHQFRNNIK